MAATQPTTSTRAAAKKKTSSAAGIAAAQTEKETVEIFSAGSLRGVVGELAKEAAATYNIEVKPSFGGSGSMRERIEKGESPLAIASRLGQRRTAHRGFACQISFCAIRTGVFTSRAA